MHRLPVRGPGVRDLDLPLPPRRMPAIRAGRPLKRWRYIGAYSPEVMVCVGDVRVGPMPQRFWAIAEPGRPVEAATTIGRAGVRLDGSRATVTHGHVRIDVEVDEANGVESVNRSGSRGYIWTRKQAGIPARGSVEIDGRTHRLDCHGVVDETAGYHERHTSWIWSAGVGTASDGRNVGWNLVTGVNDGPTDSERTVWIDGEPRETEPVTFEPDLSRVSFADGSALEFTAWGAREDRTNLLLVRSAYRQPFGTFAGTLPGGLELESGYGVMEWHEVYW
jgi:hypothetical protein